MSGHSQKTLQTPSAYAKKTQRMRRLFRRYNLLGRAYAASLTVEAALALPIFLILCGFLIQPMGWLRSYGHSLAEVQKLGRKLAQQSYVGAYAEKLRLLPSDETQGDWLDALGINMQLQLTARQLRQESGVEIKPCWGYRDGDDIRINGAVQPEVLSWLQKSGLPIRALEFHYVCRAWTGAAPLSEEAEDTADVQPAYVYVGNNRSRYHLSADCSYLRHTVYPATVRPGAALSAMGERYVPCETCFSRGELSGSDGEALPVTVYICREGRAYHRQAGCRSMHSYIRRVPLSEVEHLGACHRCGK